MRAVPVNSKRLNSIGTFDASGFRRATRSTPCAAASSDYATATLAVALARGTGESGTHVIDGEIWASRQSSQAWQETAAASRVSSAATASQSDTLN